MILPTANTWRLYHERPHEAVFLDIETTGLSPETDEITLIEAMVPDEPETRGQSSDRDRRRRRRVAVGFLPSPLSNGFAGKHIPFRDLPSRGPYCSLPVLAVRYSFNSPAASRPKVTHVSSCIPLG